MTHPHLDLVVVGGGVAGLTIALDAARGGMRVALREAGDALGGMLRRADLDGVAVDVGAESFATRTTGVADLIADAGLDLRIVEPAPGGAHLAALADGEVLRAPLPRRTVLGIPADPEADDVVRILGAEGAAQAAAERVLPRSARPGEPEPSLHDLVAGRCGAVLAQRLVDPLCRSVYSVPAASVRLSRLNPALWDAYLRHGSLIAAAAELASPARAGAAVAGIEGGMWRLAAALEHAARDLGADLRTGSPVRALEPTTYGVGVVLDDEVLRAPRVVVATGANAARALLGVDPVAVPPVHVAAALVDSAGLDAHPVGSGVIVAADVPAAAKALTHTSAKWAWAGRSDGRHLLRLSARDDAAGLAAPADIAREVSLLTGVRIAESDVVAVSRTTWTDAVPAAPVDTDRRSALAAAGIVLAGAAVAGTGLASVIPHARAVARDLLAPLTPLTPDVAPDGPAAPAPRRNP